MNSAEEPPAPSSAESPRTPGSPGRLASITSKIVNLVSSPLRRTAENLGASTDHGKMLLPPRLGTEELPLTPDNCDATAMLGTDGMLIDEEITLRPRGGSGPAGLVQAQPLEQSVSSEQFFTPHPSMEPVAKAEIRETKGKSVSQESIVELPRSYSLIDAGGGGGGEGLLSFTEPTSPTQLAPTSAGTPLKQSLLDLEPLCPLSPNSQPKYSEREMSALRTQLEERSERQTELLQYEISVLQEKCAASLQVAAELRELLTEYEQTMAQIVETRRENSESLSSVEQLVQDKRQLLVDVQAMQISFANLKQRYEENKTMNEQLRLVGRRRDPARELFLPDRCCWCSMSKA